MTTRCVLCGSWQIQLVESIRVRDIVRLYNRSLGIDVSGELHNVDILGLYACGDCGCRLFSPPLAGSEAFYEELQGLEWYYLKDKVEYESARKFVRPCDRILEVGCGSGLFADKIDSCDYVGLEFSPKAAELAREKGLLVYNEAVEDHALRFTEHYDVVCAFQVLEHVPDARSFIEACLKCLKPGGMLIYSVPSADSFVTMAVNNPLNLPPHHLTWWPDVCLHNLAALFGLEVMQVIHERLENIHKDWYTQVVVMRILSRFFHAKPRTIDLSTKYRMMQSISRRCARVLKDVLVDERILPHGHSVTAIYRK